MEKRAWPRSVVGPVILVAVGIAFLLSNLGVLPLNIWQMFWRLWPVWLIAAGLDLLIGRRTRWGGLVVAAVVLAILGGGIWYFGAGPTTRGLELTAQTINQPLGDATRAEVEIQSSVGELRLQSTADRTALLSGTVNRLTGERVYHDFSRHGDTARFVLESDLTTMVPSVGHRQGVWDLGLTENVPVSLKVRTGVGESHIDLSRLNLTDLDLGMGVGEVEVTMPARGTLRATIHAGVGQATVYIPSTMAARIEAHAGLGGISVSGDYDRQGDYRISPGYEAAANRLDLNIAGGIGEVRIVQVNP